MDTQKRHRILLVAKDGREAIRLSSLYTDSGTGVVHVVDDLRAAQGLTDRKYGIELMVVRQSFMADVKIPESLVELSDHFPVLVLSEMISETILHHARFEEKIRFFHMPADDANLIGVSRKMATGKPVKQQVHKRFATDNIANIEVYGDGQMSRGQLLNLSKSGAYLRFQPSKFDFANGDLLQLTFHLEQVKKVRTMNAEVVWVKDLGEDDRGMGVHFINGDQIFNKLMNRC